jgi:hypothetical protein
MNSLLTSSAAIAALLAAGHIGSATAATTSAAGDFNTENGVRAAPSGHVDLAPLAKLPRVNAQPEHIAPISSASRAAGARLIRASAIRIAAAHAATPASVYAAAPRPVQLALADPAPDDAASADADDVRAPLASDPPQDPPATDDPPRNPDPVAADEAEADSAPATVADQDAVEEPGPEEAAVYGLRRPAAVATPADSVADDPPRSAALADADPPAGRHVAFPRRSAEAAAAFDRYMRRVAAIGPDLKTGSDVAEALRTAAAYEPLQFEEGMIAYGAMAALQDARFVYAVMGVGDDARSRQALVDAILDDPSTARRLPYASEASALAGAAILHEARPVIAVGLALKQAAYDVQRDSWSLAKAQDGAMRLARAKAVSAARVSTADGEMSRLLTRITGWKDPAETGAPPFGRISDHSLALAALAILDSAGDGNADRLGGLLSEASSAQCLKMAKLNLFQCLSVAGPEYEEVYCLGQHAVLDTGRCVAGGADPTGAMDVSSLGSGRSLRSPLLSRETR